MAPSPAPPPLHTRMHAGQHTGIAITRARPDCVVGEIRIEPQGLTPAGLVRGAAIQGLAEELTLHGAQLNVADGTALQILEAKASYFTPSRSGMLGAEATPLHRGPSTMVWQTMVYEPDGTHVAQVTHTVLLTAATGSPAPPILLPISVPARPQADRREAIAAAACAVIARKGFAAATIREIADAAGLHVPTLYQHVSSKDEVLDLVYTWAMERVRADMDAAIAHLTTARDRLLGMTVAMIRSGDAHRRQVGVLNRELRSLSAKSRLRVLDKYQELLRRIAGIIADGVAAGEFRAVDPFIVANMIDAMCDAWALRPFALRIFGLAAFEAEMAAFIDAALADGPVIGIRPASPATAKRAARRPRP